MMEGSPPTPRRLETGVPGREGEVWEGEVGDRDTAPVGVGGRGGNTAGEGGEECRFT